jgi:RNA polymerase sigma-70 factor (ECF subfamily)
MPEALYRENYPIVYGYLLSLCGDPTLAEDLTAETFLRAVEKIGTYNAAYKPSTWLCTIGRNLYRNHLKRSRRHTDLPEELPCRAPSPETLLLQREQARQVLQAAENLPPQQRQVLYMRMDGMSFRSIGLVLGKTENWARVTFFRVKTKLLEETEETP